MGILIIDGNSVFEIDEECYKKKKIAKECDIDKYMQTNRVNLLNTNGKNRESQTE